MAFKTKSEQAAAIRQTRTGLDGVSLQETAQKQPVRRRTVAPAPLTYEKKKSYTMSFHPAMREVDLPELTRILGQKSDSATLEYLVQRAKAVVLDPNFNKEQGSLFETF